MPGSALGFERSRIDYRARLCNADKLRVEPCLVDRSNAVPLQEASRNRDENRVADKARWFRLSGLRYTENPALPRE